MTETLLQTKIQIPPRRPNLVPRPRLIERLNQGLHLGHKLTLISAPAGFGKTTLLSEWLANLENDHSEPGQIRNPRKRSGEIQNQVAWLSLDEGDNDPANFLAYLIAALNHAAGEELAAGKGALDMLHSPQTPPAAAVLTTLINDITAFPRRPDIILTIDDYHAIDSLAIDEALTFLLEHLPPNMHLVIATRADPHLPLSRLRARNQLSELRAADLRFSSTEAAEFLNQVMGLNLSTEDIAALETRTEGWIAGLQLAAISMQGQKDIHALVNTFTGSHRYILDYLIEEVLEQQPANIQDFLLQTALFKRLSGSLCDAITAQKDSQATLEMLERTNLFIVPLDEQRRWYRYHHLFADLLRRRLRQTQPDKISLLRNRASTWFEQNDFIEEAIDQALIAGDFQRAAALIARVADDAWARGQDYKLRYWLEKLPSELVYNNPQFCIYLAWSLLADGELGEAHKALEAAEGALESTFKNAPETTIQEQALRGKIAATHAFAAFYRGELPQIFRYATLALDALPEQEQAWRSTATHLLGDAYDFQGDMVRAYPSRVEAVQASQVTGNSYVSMIANLKLAIILRRRGMLREALEICEQQMALAIDSGMAQTVVGGWLLAIWGEVLAETNELDEARVKAQKSAERIERDGDLAMIGSSYLGLIRIFFSCADFAAAEECIHKVEKLAREFDMPPWINRLAAAWQARLWLAQEELPAVLRWAAENEPGDAEDLTYVRETELVDLARIFIAQGQLGEAGALLERLLGPARTYGRTWRVIEILMLQALAYQAAGDTDRGLTALEQALITAEPCGLMRTFLDEGPPMAQLLHEAATRGIVPDYAGRLSAAFTTSDPEQSGAPKIHSAIPTQAKRLNPHTASAESLSEREREVLQLIAQGLTNSQIAARLYLSLNTVKAHTRNIYGKLDVHTRTQAVARATELGII